jgi:hypothetical protein
MQQHRFRIYRPRSLQEAEELMEMRRVVAASRKILESAPAPDTFLGRPTFRPFPFEQNASPAALKRKGEHH